MPSIYICKGYSLILYILITLAAFGLPETAAAQQVRDTSKTTLIRILENEYGEFIQSDSVSVHKLKGNVKLLHGSDTLYCDSAYFYTKRNNVEAFGDVVIRQADGTEASADYMRYNGATKVVYMRADQPNREVQLYDGKTNTLWSREIDYNMMTKIGRYKRRGYLQTESTNLESNTGEYNMRSKDARFRGDVVVNDPEYQAVSTDLGYNTETRVARFFGPSVVTNDKSTLQTSKGVYDTRNRTSHFVDRSSILNESQYIEADTLDYDRNSGFGFAIGNVIAIDTGMKSTLYCGYAQYNEIHRTLLAYVKPLMKKMNGKKALFIKADTFFSAPDPRFGKKMTAQDSLQRTADEIRSAVGADSTLLMSDSLGQETDSLAADTTGAGSFVPSGDLDEVLKDTAMHQAPVARDTATVLAAADSAGKTPPAVDSLKHKMDAMVYRRKDAETGQLSATADTLSPGEERRRRLDSASLSYHNTPEPVDTSAPRYFLGYHHVLIYSDSLQGKCDSIRYSQVDSLLRMYTNPYLWPQNSQLKGDIIYLQMDSSRLREVIVPRNAIMISRNGPEKAEMFDQIQGNTIHAYLRDNKMDSLIAVPNASSIYFIKDDDSAYVGSSEAKSDKIEVHFENESIRRIYYRVDVEQKTTPMKDVIPSALRLSRFSWEEKQRPKTFEEFLEGTTLPHEPKLLYPGSEKALPAEDETVPEVPSDKPEPTGEAAKPPKKEPE
ncbi:OstA-like protein [Taibaiella helva]|uniref:OstA-like protein n=1 Tax=Taibaiella helva TaxID=2301235 RepID=UPI000E57D076|nr:OstA-like protein [Taibaiella helva]